MPKVFRTPIQRKNPITGKLENAVDDAGNTLYHARWRIIIIDHKGKRKTYTFGTNKTLAQKQADMLVTREREIRNGIRNTPAIENKSAWRSFDDVCREYFAWGQARGGRRNLPWADEYVVRKKRNLDFWRVCLGLERLGDLYGVLPRVEAECHKMLAAGRAGKTVANKAQDLGAFIKWCGKRKYIKEDPLAELGKFDTSPKVLRRAMTPEELRALLENCAPHRRLLYEVAFCTGLRENELRRLEPRFLDRLECAIAIPKEIDKGRKSRVQYIPAALMKRLEAFVAAGEARATYERTYRYHWEREGRKKPPENPLLYVPANSSTMLKKDLAAAGIPLLTEKGKLDFHALRTAYVNFILEMAPDVKTAQELARHESAHMTLNVYGRAKAERCRSVVEAVGNLVFPDEQPTD